MFVMVADLESRDVPPVPQGDTLERDRYCAFGDYDKETNDSEQLVQNRMPYVQWLVEHVAAQLTSEEVALRRQHGKVSGLVEAARRDAEEWARQVCAMLKSIS